MDAVTVGGYFISAALQVLFDRLAPNATTILQFFKGSNSNGNKLLKELEITLISVSKVLGDAEQKEISDQHVRKWLDEIKDVVYDADDLLAEIDYDSRVIAAESSSLEAARSLCALGVPSGKENNIEEKLQNILYRLTELKKHAKVLGLVEVIGHGVPRHLYIERRTTSLVEESEVYGREADKEVIISLLMSEDTKSTSGLGIIAIVGMGGLGKTTLAQLVYSQMKILKHYDLTAWFTVSDETDAFLITKNILKGFAPQLPGIDSMTEDVVHNQLKDTLTTKKFLLVLDDIWDEKPENLDLLMRPLKCGMQGSRIIVTTRSPVVASLTSTVPAYSLKLLSDDESWSIFARCAFQCEDSSAYPELVPFGKQIVAKCGRLPLAVKSLGNLLRTTKEKRKWKEISDSEIWNLKQDRSILPALRLSYHWLSSGLKRCFAYCALFPKDYEFDKNELVMLWMADGILDSDEGTRSKKDVGDDYFDDLLSRSFFQRSSKNSSYFVMHDLIHDLATSVAGDFYIRMKNNPSSQSRQPRHVSYISSGYNTLTKFADIFSNQSLRSFLPIRQFRWVMDEYMTKDVVEHLLETSKYLRVLSLSKYVNIKEVPESIVKMKLMRYLDLSGTSLRRLPDAICKLWNLETLLLAACKFLEEVPESIVDLKNLHFLNLSRTAIKRLPTNLCNLIELCFLDIRNTNLQETPPNLGNLTRLQILTDFFVGDKNSCNSSIMELKDLSRLKGKLRIWNLQNVHNAQVASESNLKGKEHLRKLDLRWKGDDADDSQLELKVLEGLEPSCTLESLTISGYRGTYFSKWVGHPSFSNLSSLRIEKCINCYEMPSLGQLDSLKKLHISECPNIVIIGASFYGNDVPATDKTPFKSLQILRFEKLLEWKTWEQHDGAFSNLEELCISDCPKFADALPGKLPSLKKLEDENCAMELNPSLGLRFIGKNSGSILSLDQILENLQGMGASIYVQKRVVFGFRGWGIGCQNWEEVLQKFVCLESLAIVKCSKLVIFPKCEFAYQNLTKLKLERLRNLKSLPERMNSILPCLMELTLKSCPELELSHEGSLPFKLEKLQILDCKKFMAGRMLWNLQAMTSLSVGGIGYSFDEDMESFPRPIVLPCTLTTFVAVGWKRIDYNWLKHLTSLTTLEIQATSSIEKLSEEGLPQFLTTLTIYSLPNLKSLSPIERLTSLRTLEIYHCESISEVQLLPSTITCLILKDIKMKSLDGWGIHRLACLEKLDIRDCRLLESISEEALPTSLRLVILEDCPMLRHITREGLPPSLERLSIINCSLLEEKYNEKEEERHIVSHIPNVHIRSIEKKFPGNHPTFWLTGDYIPIRYML